MRRIKLAVVAAIAVTLVVTMEPAFAKPNPCPPQQSQDLTFCERGGAGKQGGGSGGRAESKFETADGGASHRFTSLQTGGGGEGAGGPGEQGGGGGGGRSSLESSTGSFGNVFTFEASGGSGGGGPGGGGGGGGHCSLDSEGNFQQSGPVCPI